MNKPTRKFISDDIRRLIIKKLIEDGEAITKVANDLCLKRTTVSEIFRLFKRTGRIEKSKVRGHPTRIISGEIGTYIEKLIELDPGITLGELRSRLIDEKGITVSNMTIRNYMLSLKITLKRCNIVLERVNDPERLKLRKVFATDFLLNASLDDRKNIFVDETGFNLHMRRNYGRSTSGKRVSATVPTIRGRNTTLLSAINGSGVIHQKTFTGSCNSELFSEFLQELDAILVNQHNISDGCIYMDNARAHTANNTRNVMATLVNNTKFLSPYSYMLNPIEYSFSKIKAIIRRLLTNEDSSLSNLIRNALSQITKENCEGWFAHARRNCVLASQEFIFK